MSLVMLGILKFPSESFTLYEGIGEREDYRNTQGNFAKPELCGSFRLI